MKLSASITCLSLVAVVFGPTACAEPCVDHGLGQEKCPEDDASATQTATDSQASASMTMTMTESDSNTLTASESATESESVTDTDSSTVTATTGGSTMWCLDLDGDGYGDPNHTVWADEQPEGYVDNCEDCDDTNPNAFPGAAPKDDPEACMLDQDGDGWGDANPGPNVVPGSDCWDHNPNLAPDTVELAAIERVLLNNDIVTAINKSTAAKSLIAPLDTLLNSLGANAVSVGPQGQIFANATSSHRLHKIDYSLVCVGTLTLGLVEELDEPHGLGAAMCAMAFGPGAQLHGIDATSNSLVRFDTTTGEVVSSTPITLDGSPLTVSDCGLAFDCHEQRLLLANGADGRIYELSHSTGAATALADTGLTGPFGVEYEPHLASEAAKGVYLSSSGNTLSRVTLDGSNTVTTIGTMSGGLASSNVVDHLNHLPECKP